MPSRNFMFTSTSGFKSIVPTEETSRSPPSTREMKNNYQNVTTDIDNEQDFGVVIVPFNTLFS